MVNGFRIYKNLDLVGALPPDPIEKEEVAPSSVDDMLNLIYALDPITGLPSGAINQYLSDKTNEQVRQFIEKNLLIEHDNGSHDYPSDIREEILKLDSSFIAETSRNRFESVEDYEARVQDYFDKIEADKEFQKKCAMIRKKFGSKKDESES